MAAAPGHAVRLGHSARPAGSARPGQVLDRRRHSYHWSALVVTVRIEAGRPVVVQEWVPAERLRPVRSDPNRRQLGHY